MGSNRNVLAIQVKVDGSTKLGPFDLKDGNHIRRVEVDQRLDSPAYFSVTIKSGDVAAPSSKTFAVLDKIKLGAEIEIRLGYDSEKTVFKGEVSQIEPSFFQTEHEVRFAGYDIVHRLTRGTASRTWGDGHKADVDVGSVAKEVISGSKARKGNTSDALSTTTGKGQTKHAYVAQYRMNDYEFLRGLGVGTSMTFDSQASTNAKKVVFKQIDTSSNPVVTVCRENLDPKTARLSLGAEFSISTVQQVARVEVRGWDPEKKKAIMGKAERVSRPIEGKDGPKQAGKAHYGSASTGRVLTIVDCPVSSKQEAEEIAESVLNGLAMEFCAADITVEGVPDVTPGDVVEVKQFGKMYSGKYLVDGVRHLVNAGARDPYVTRLKLIRNSAPEP